MEEKVKEKQMGQRVYQKGDTEIRVKSEKNQTSNTDSSEYVDYEEVD